MFLADSTTWELVAIKPCEFNAKPDPVPITGNSVGLTAGKVLL